MPELPVPELPRPELPGPKRRLAIVPARNEEDAVGRVVAELRAFDAGLDVVVIDDGSEDLTAARAEAAGAAVVSLPFNLGIGGAVQTGFKYALEHDYDTVIRLDGDGQHDPQQIPNLLAPLERAPASSRAAATTRRRSPAVLGSGGSRSSSRCSQGRS